MTGLARVFIARLTGAGVFDPNGDQVGKTRDVVVALRTPPRAPRVVGLVVEVPPRRRIFIPITRVTSIDAGAVVVTGLVNMKRFEQRPGEVLVVGELLDSRASVCIWRVPKASAPRTTASGLPVKAASVKTSRTW